jgi:hypothetical protein
MFILILENNLTYEQAILFRQSELILGFCLCNLIPAVLLTSK